MYALFEYLFRFFHTARTPQRNVSGVPCIFEHLAGSWIPGKGMNVGKPAGIKEGECLRLTLIPQQSGLAFPFLSAEHKVAPEVFRRFCPGKRPPHHPDQGFPDYRQTAVFSRGLVLSPLTRDCPTINVISCARARCSPSSSAVETDGHLATSSISSLIANPFRTGRYPKVAAPLGRPARPGLPGRV